MRVWQVMLLGGLVTSLVACGGGGSGSTGLVTSESTIVDDVRTSGTCDAFEGVTYCGSDSPSAVAPGGESVRIVDAAPTATPVAAGTATPAKSPSAALPTPTPDASSPSAAPPTPQFTATAAPATPVSTPTPAAATSVSVLLEGFEAGAACAAAARPAGTDVSWATAPLVPVAPSGVPTTLPLPAGVLPPRDEALVCYDAPPSSLPAEVATLADADPTVVFVLPGP